MVMHLHDDILGAILERIDSQVTLLRAASICKRWRGIIADAAFLRRFRSLHAPAIAGEYYCKYPLSFIPSSSSPIDANHYSLDFLPDHKGAEDYWRLEDNRGSLLMMKHLSDIRYLVVCEPLTRRYKRIPQPLELIDVMNNYIWCPRQFYLIDGAGEEEAGSNIGMSKFRVVCEHYMDRTMHVMVFNPNDGSDTSSTAWKEKDISSIVEAGVSGLRKVGRAAGSWYFCDVDRSNILIVLDGRTGEFSTSMMPAKESWEIRGFCNYCVTDGRDGKPRVCSVVEGTMKVFALRDGQWALETSLLLEEAIRGLPGYKPGFNRCVGILTRGPGFVILSFRTSEMWTVSVDLETMKVTSGPVEAMKRMVYRCELPWPPALNACVDK